MEFFDQSFIKNLVATIALKPEKLIIAFDESKVSERSINQLLNYINHYEKNVVLGQYHLDTTSIETIKKSCEKIASENNNAFFNITGGGELTASAVTLFCKEHKLPAFYIDLEEGKLIDAVGCTSCQDNFSLPALSVEKVIAINGSEFKRSDHYVPNIKDKSLINDFINIFEIFLRHNENWYGFVSYMQEAGKDPFISENEIKIVAPNYIEVNRQRKVSSNNHILKELENKGIVSNLVIEKGKISFNIKNEMILSQLKLQGSWLEQFCYINSAQMGYFDDVKMSVIIDVDGPIEDFAVIQNEIDLICVKGINAIFVSCKSSPPTALTLSEIKQLTNKFGGETAKAVVASSSNISDQNPAIYKRAMEMGIYVIELSDLNPVNFALRMEEISNGSYKYAHHSSEMY